MFGRDDGVIPVKEELTCIVNDSWSMKEPKTELSSASSVKAVVLRRVGVPEMMPLEAFRESPAGNDPETTLKPRFPWEEAVFTV